MASAVDGLSSSQNTESFPGEWENVEAAMGALGDSTSLSPCAAEAKADYVCICSAAYHASPNLRAFPINSYGPSSSRDGIHILVSSPERAAELGVLLALDFADCEYDICTIFVVAVGHMAIALR